MVAVAVVGWWRRCLCWLFWRDAADLALEDDDDDDEVALTVVVDDTESSNNKSKEDLNSMKRWNEGIESC
jgi:hypothetical protein